VVAAVEVEMEVQELSLLRNIINQDYSVKKIKQLQNLHSLFE
jgi:hypothetical protein